MSPPRHGGGAAGRPPGPPTEQTEAATTQHDHQDLSEALHRRADAARRLPPLPWRAGCGGGILRERDPWITPAQRDASPSTFGLTPRELRAEARRLRRDGWNPEDIRKVLAVDFEGAA